MKILIIEDERDLNESIASYLREQGYVCDSAFTFPEAMDKVESFEYECILLDITLQDGNGLDILKTLKSNGKTEGVLIISARNSLTDKVTGLTLGADDYLPKPFHLSELGARVSAIIRRKQFGGNNLIQFGALVLDTMARTTTVEGREIDLTRKEYQLLLYFACNKGRVLSKNAIAEHLWGEDLGGGVNYDFIYTHIKNLRRKLVEAGAEDHIQSIYGMGYKFSAH
jgi:DNA-binding response OmpR family regulator